MSVDTYMKGKRTAGYEQVSRGDVTLLLSPRLIAWAENVQVTTKRVVGRRRLNVLVEHRHDEACTH